MKWPEMTDGKMNSNDGCHFIGSKVQGWFIPISRNDSIVECSVSQAKFGFGATTTPVKLAMAPRSRHDKSWHVTSSDVGIYRYTDIIKRKLWRGICICMFSFRLIQLWNSHLVIFIVSRGEMCSCATHGCLLRTQSVGPHINHRRS